MDKDKRDLYADLEISGFTNDVALIKKQYKKLSLLRHPDRPGGSNEAFSIINHAHNVLTDPDKKRKYDADFSRRNRTAYASGVRGNPWAAAGNQWAPPPRPPNFPKRPTPAPQKRQPSTAEKFAEMAGSAGSARRAQAKPAEGTYSQWQAWNDIRAGAKNKPTAAGQNTGDGPSARSASASRPPPPPPPVPPRPTAPQKQPKGSFGARVQKNGYIPESTGDEGAHSKNNYFTTRTHSNLFTETSTAARARRRAPSSPPANAEDDSGFADARHSTPYQTQGGERFDPWNASSTIDGSRSTRDSIRRPHETEEHVSARETDTRQRSASIPDVADVLPSEAQDGNSERPASTTPASGGYQKSPTGSDTSHSKEGHQLYADRSLFSSTTPTPKVHQKSQRAQSRTAGDALHNKKTLTLPAELQQLMAKFESSSEDKSTTHGGLNGFEQNLQKVIQQLSVNKYGPQGTVTESAKQAAHTAAQQSMNRANKNDHNSFDSQTGTPMDTHRYTRNSTDYIDTRFVAEEDANYQFSAGSPVAEDGRPGMPRSKSGSRVGRSPVSAQAPHSPFPQPSNSSSAQNGSFDPAEWSEKMNPSIFEAPTTQKTPAPTGRPMRKSSKKPVRMTAGTAGMVETDESSSGQEDPFKDPTASNRTSGSAVDGATSPTPMDVDTPMNEAAENGVRNIPVTPSRPEWRAGDLGLGIKAEAKPMDGQQAQFSPSVVGGSEDSEEFQASFADLRNVEPFAQRSAGLESFADLKTDLPFQSAAAGQVPIRKPVGHKSHHLNLPVAPKPPVSPEAFALDLKPPNATWQNYMENFARYLVDWHLYNTLFIDHFAARRVQVQHKLSNLAWLSSRDGAGLAEYNDWEEQDHAVREKWTAACNSHEMHMRSYTINRQKMAK